MIWTVIQTSWRRLRNNRSELLLTFIVPMVFFSIFALIFGSRDSSSSTPKIKVAISNEFPTELSDRSVALLQEQKSLRLTDRSKKSTDHATSSISVSRESAEDLVRRGMVSAAVVFSKADPKSGGQPEIQILTDSFDQVASQVLTAVVQKAVMTANAEISKAHPPQFNPPKSIRSPKPVSAIAHRSRALCRPPISRRPLRLQPSMLSVAKRPILSSPCMQLVSPLCSCSLARPLPAALCSKNAKTPPSIGCSVADSPWTSYC